MSEEISRVNKKIDDMQMVDEKVNTLTTDMKRLCQDESRQVLSFVVRNLPERNAEVITDEIDTLIRTGLKLEINIKRAERKKSYNGNNGIVIAWCKSSADKMAIMEKKRILSSHQRYGKVYIDQNKSYEERLSEGNMRALVNVLGKDKIHMRGRRVFPKGIKQGDKQHESNTTSKNDTEQHVNTSIDPGMYEIGESSRDPSLKYKPLKNTPKSQATTREQC